MSAAKERLSLSQAVQAYSARWSEWLALNQNDQAEAIHVLDARASLPKRVTLDAEVASKGYPGDQTRTARQRVRDAQMLAEEIIDDFKAKCSRGELELHGFVGPSLKPIRIPADVCGSLAFDLEQGIARVGAAEYVGITVRRPGDDRGAAAVSAKPTAGPRRVAMDQLRLFVETMLSEGTPSQVAVYQAALKRFPGATRRAVRLLCRQLASNAKPGPRKQPAGQ